jgi:hypothetical protein
MLEMMEGDYPQRRHLLTDDDRANLPDFYETEKHGLEAQALLKFALPENNAIWYVVEFDGEDLLHGLIVDDEIELCYFSLQELENQKSIFGDIVERDDDYIPQSLIELIEFHKSEGKKVGYLEGYKQKGIFENLKSYSERIAKWDNNIVGIVGIGDLSDETFESVDTIELVCVYASEPKNESDAFFLIANLMTRERHEGLAEALQIPNNIDFGFEMKGKYYLPSGKIIEKPDSRVTIWRKHNAGEFDK